MCVSIQTPKEEHAEINLSFFSVCTVNSQVPVTQSLLRSKSLQPFPLTSILTQLCREGKSSVNTEGPCLRASAK